MHRLVIKGLILFVILTITTSLIVQIFDVKYGEVNYFLRHGYLFLIFITIFPRLTLLISSVPFGGLLWWLSFFFCPRILVASLATMNYFKTNPVLVVIAWLVALGGELFEKSFLSKPRIYFSFKNFRPQPTAQSNHRHVEDGVFEAEYKVKDD